MVTALTQGEARDDDGDVVDTIEIRRMIGGASNAFLYDLLDPVKSAAAGRPVLPTFKIGGRRRAIRGDVRAWVRQVADDAANRPPPERPGPTPLVPPAYPPRKRGRPKKVAVAAPGAGVGR